MIALAQGAYVEDDELGLEERGCAWLFGAPGPEGNRDRVVVAMDWPVRGEILVALCDARGDEGEDAAGWTSKELVDMLETADFALQPQAAVEETFRRLHSQIVERRSGTSGLTLVHLSPTRVVTACIGTGRAAFVGGSGFRPLAKDPQPERSLGDARYSREACKPRVVVKDRTFGNRFLFVATGDVWEAMGREQDRFCDAFAATDAETVCDRLSSVVSFGDAGTGAAIFVALRQGPID